MHFRAPKNFAGRVARVLCRNRHFRVQLKRPRRITISGRFSEYADFHAIEEVYIDDVYRLESILTRPDCIIDAGGHIGGFSIFASKVFSGVHVVAFEPDPKNAALFEQNVSDNQVEVELHHCALSSQTGTAYLSGHSSMDQRLGGEKGTLIQVRRLTDVVEFGAISRLLFKLDVEGAEWDVLENCRSALPIDTLLLIETHGGSADLERLRQFAATDGYEMEHTNTKGEFNECFLRRGSFRQG